jgi:hypothetical protein
MIPAGGTRADLKGWQNMAAGAMAGKAYWTAFFPADTVKSRMQSADPTATTRSFVWWLRHLYATTGLRGLYRGWGITVSRAAPSNAVLFLVYELTAKYLA